MLQPLLAGKRLKRPRLNLGLNLSLLSLETRSWGRKWAGSMPSTPRHANTQEGFPYHLLCFLIRRNKNFPFRGPLVEQGIHPSSPPAAPPGYQERLERVMKLQNRKTQTGDSSSLANTFHLITQL